jgi:CheY-like chemotaxis protein
VPRGQGQHVLYIDDDEVLRITVESLLRRCDYRVTCHGDPRVALAALQADPDGFDLVISDYNMPEMSGLDLARAVRRLRPELPVIITSGYASEELQAGASDAGVFHVLLKQYTVERLAGVVEEALTAPVG